MPNAPLSFTTIEVDDECDDEEVDYYVHFKHYSSHDVSTEACISYEFDDDKN